jgi:signal transduction histidine kinase
MNVESFAINFINPFVISSIINGLIGLLFGVFIYLSNRESRLHQIWLLFSLCYAVWGFSLGMMAGSHDKDYSLFWGRALFAGAIFIPITYTHSLFVFLDKEKQYKRFLWIFYLLSLFFFFSNFTEYFVLETRPILSFAYWTKAGILMYPFALMFFGLVVFGMIQLIKVYQDASGTHRSQIQYFLLAMTIGFSGGATNFLLTFDIPIYPYGNYIVSSHIIIMSYAIVKYRLMDIDTVYRKGTVYSAGLLFILLPAFLAILLTERLFIGSVNLNLSIVFLFILAVSAIAFYKLKIKTERTLENTLFYKKYNPYKVLSNFTKEMVSVITLDELLNKIINTFVETLKIKKASVFLFDEEKKNYEMKASYGLDEEKNKIKIKQEDALISYFITKEDVAIWEEIERYPSTQQTQEMVKILKDMKSEIAIPFMEKNKIVGFCNLSAKGDRSMYSHEDIELFLSLGRQAAIAIKNAMLIEKIKESKQVIRRMERLKTIGDMAAGLAHEIRNPLVPIKTCLQLLPERYGKDEEFTEKIPIRALQEVERIEALLKEIMDYSRPRAPVLKDEDINDIVEKTVIFVEYEAKKKGIKIERKYENQLPMAKVDNEQIKQVILNLIFNAIDAVNGDGKIEITTRKTKHILSPTGRIGEKEYIQIEVTDNGMGIPEENIERIFNPFYTTKHESKEREGTGLGLSIVQEIVTEHNGFIQVKSELGKGTTFLVNLPIDLSEFEQREDRRRS